MSTAVLTAVAWVYRNGGRHIGHKSGSGVASGVFARYHRMAGNRVLMESGPASPENATQAPKTGWPYVDPNPPGTLRQSRTTVYRLLARLIRRPGAKDPDHEYVADTAVDRHHRDRRYAPAGLIDYLDAGGPVVPVAPARHRATPALPPAEARTRPSQQARARGV